MVIKQKKLIHWKVNFQKETFCLMQLRGKENFAYFEQKLDF